MKLKKWSLIIMVAIMMTASTVNTALAEENTTSEATVLTPENVEDLIAVIDAEYPRQDDVAAAREAFDTLTMAQQVNVRNYATLLSAEKRLAEKNGDNPDQSQKKGTRYSFRISEYVPKVTLTVKYMTDTDKDGVMEPPSVTLISPTGSSIRIADDQTSVKSTWYELSIEKSAAATTINILKAENGTWTIEADNEVVFSASDYKDAMSYSEVDSENTTTKETQDSSNNSNNSNKKGTKSNLFPMIGLIVCIGALIYLFVMMQKTPSPQHKSESKKKENDEEDDEQSEEDFQAEVQRLLADFEKKKDEAQEDAAPVITEDSRLFESVTADELTEAEDDGISPLNGDDYNGRFR